jgi:putative oxidoreductase
MEENRRRDLFFPILSSDSLMGPFLLTARLFTTGIFVFYILDEIRTPHATSALTYLAAAIQFVGIILVALGYKTRFAALLLAFCIITRLLFNGSAGPAAVFMIHLLKDLALAGGFLFMFAYGPGPLSLDGHRGGGKPRGMEDDSRQSFFSPLLGSNMAMGLLLFAGRVLSTVVFFYYGSSKILHTSRMQAYMVAHNSHVPINLIYLAILTQIVPPALVLLGYKTRYGALALAGFCIIATSLFHAEFGNHAEVEQFLLDFALAGGLLFMFACGPGPLSFDERERR